VSYPCPKDISTVALHGVITANACCLGGRQASYNLTLGVIIQISINCFQYKVQAELFLCDGQAFCTSCNDACTVSIILLVLHLLSFCRYSCSICWYGELGNT